MQKNFSNELKLTDITPILKKVGSTLAKNCKPVSALSCVSKRFKSIMQTVISIHRQKFFNHF